MPLISVAGGSWKEGNCFASAGFCGPGSLNDVGSCTLILPSGGVSGLPKEAALAAAVTTPSAATDAAAPNTTWRLNWSVMGNPRCGTRSQATNRRLTGQSPRDYNTV